MRTNQLFLILSTLASLAIATPIRRNETLPAITSVAALTSNAPLSAILTSSAASAIVPPSAPDGQSQLTVMTDAAGKPTNVTLYASTAPTLDSATVVASTPTPVPVGPVTTLVPVATPAPTSPPPPPPPASTKPDKVPKPSKSSKDSKVAKNRYSSSKAMQYARALAEAEARSLPEEGDIVHKKRVITGEVGLRRVGVDFEERDGAIIPDTAVAVPATEVIPGPPPKDLPLAPGATVITVDATPAAPTTTTAAKPPKKTQKDKSGIAASIWNSSKVGRFKRGEEGDVAVREETGVIADEVDLHGDDVDVVRRGEGAKAGFIGVEG